LIVSEALSRPAQDGKDTHTMTENNVVALKKPQSFVGDPITEIFHQGARRLRM
jgi:hypothetical protein